MWCGENISLDMTKLISGELILASSSQQNSCLAFGVYECVRDGFLYMHNPHFRIRRESIGNVDFPVLLKGIEQDYHRSRKIKSIQELFVGQEEIADALEKRGYEHYAGLVKQMRKPYLPCLTSGA